MTDTRVVRIERLDMAFAPRPWPFADRVAREIDAHFAKRKAARQSGDLERRRTDAREHAMDGRCSADRWLKMDYASFMTWSDWGVPEAGVQRLLRPGCAARPRTAHFCWASWSAHCERRAYLFSLPVRLIEATSIGTKVDFDANVWRELREETGLTAADLDAEHGWHTVLAGQRLAHIKVLQAREDADTLRAKILGVLAQQNQPELSDIRVVRSPADFDPMVQDFIIAFLTEAWRG